MQRSEYKTKQRNLIINFLAENKNKHLTAEMIITALEGVVGQTTVYRNLEKLALEKVIVKYEMPEGKSAYYQYVDDISHYAHCHLLCTRCGDMINLDCGFIKQLSSHIMNEHKFRLDNKKAVLYGLCEKCL